MPRWTNGDRARIEYRRTLVQRLNARGLRLYEIADNLDRQGVVNPDTGAPYDLSTISRDITELERRWREEANKERSEYKARQLMELREARSRAWAGKDYAEVRRNLETEMKLLGTQEPMRQEITGAGGGPVVVVNWDDPGDPA